MIVPDETRQKKNEREKQATVTRVKKPIFLPHVFTQKGNF